MIDSLVKHKSLAENSEIKNQLGLTIQGTPEKYCLVTLHRPSNVDEHTGLRIILQALKSIGGQIRIVFPVHPRTKNNIQKLGLADLLSSIPNLTITEPLGYLDFLCLEMGAELVITDSGGIQEETTYMQIPCLTLRENTERPITITLGTNQLVPLEQDVVIEKAEDILKGIHKQGNIPALWDGHTAKRIVQLLR